MRRDRDNYLFNTHDLHAVIDAQGRALSQEISNLANGVIQGTEEAELIRSLHDKYKLDSLNINEEGIEVEQADTEIDVSHDTMRLFTTPGPHYVRGFKFTYYIPFSGDPDLFKCRPSTYSLMLPYAEIRGNNLIIEVDVENPETTDPDSQMQGELNRIKQSANQVNEDIAPFNNTLEGRVRTELQARKDKLQQVNQVIAGSKYRMRTSGNSPTTYPTTSIERKTTLDVIISTTPGTKPVPVLTEKQYEHILGVIKSTANSIERSPSTYKNMGEEELRDVLLSQLNGHYQGKATAEAFNASGKTDILIRDQDKNIFIAECKIWAGAKVFTEAIDQLLGYTSWRDTKTALIIFNRNKDLSSVLSQIPDLVKNHANFKRELTQVDDTDFRYVLHHNDDKARELSMAVIVVELPS